MDKKIQTLCEAIQDLISKDIVTQGKIPDGFHLEFGNKNVIYTVDATLNIKLTPEGEKDFKNIYGFDTPFKVLLNPEDLNNGK